MDQPKTHRLSGYGVSESAVRIQGQETGTGVVISPRHIATCAHVVLDALGYESLNDSDDGRRIAWLPPTEPIPGGEYTFGSLDDPQAYDNEQRFSERQKSFRLGR